MRLGWCVALALVVAGCGSSSDGLSSAARDVALARLGATESFVESSPIRCAKQSSSGAARTYVCRGTITTSASSRQVAITVVCDADRKTCIR